MAERSMFTITLKMLTGAMLVFTLRLAVVTANKGLVLREFRQEDSVTSCRRGLINLLDKIVFTAQVNVTTLGEYLRSMAYEIKRPDSPSFKSICFKKIPSSCKGVENKECYCLATLDKNIYIFILNITAYSIYSRGQIRVVARYKNSTVDYSDTRDIPQIYDPTVVESILQINNEIMNESDCCITVQGSEASIEYTCVGDLPSPCRLEVINSLSNQTIVNGYNRITSTINYQESKNLSLILKKRFCQNGEVHLIYCTIYAEYVEDETTGSIDKTTVIVLCVICLIFLTIGFIAFIIWKTRLKGRHLNIKWSNKVSRKEGEMLQPEISKCESVT